MAYVVMTDMDMALYSYGLYSYGLYTSAHTTGVHVYARTYPRLTLSSQTTSCDREHYMSHRGAEPVYRHTSASQSVLLTIHQKS